MLDLELGVQAESFGEAQDASLRLKLLWCCHCCRESVLPPHISALLLWALFKDAPLDACFAVPFNSDPQRRSNGASE